jgi:phytoene/squalene synthetase
MATPASTTFFATIRHPKKRAFLYAYLEIGKILDACQRAQVPHSMHYYWKRTDAAYEAAFKEAQEILGEQLEEEARRRALGWEETHYTLDGTRYEVNKHSDTLLIFLLKGAMPKKYGDKIAHTGKDDGPIDVRGLADLLTHARNGSHEGD